MTTLIASNVFSKSIHSPNHPAVKRFKQMLAGIAECRHARIVEFSVDRGIALIRFDNDSVAFQIAEDIMDTVGIRPVIGGYQNAGHGRLRHEAG